LVNSSVEGSAFLLCLINVLHNFDNMSLVVAFSGDLRGEESWRRVWNVGICKRAGEVQVLSKCGHLVSDELQGLLREQPHDLILVLGRTKKIDAGKCCVSLKTTYDRTSKQYHHVAA
jgi:hypothetical protein